MSKPGVPLVPVLESETPGKLLSQPQKLRIGDGKQKYPTAHKSDLVRQEICDRFYQLVSQKAILPSVSLTSLGLHFPNCRRVVEMIPWPYDPLAKAQNTVPMPSECTSVACNSFRPRQVSRRAKLILGASYPDHLRWFRPALTWRCRNVTVVTIVTSISAVTRRRADQL